MFTDLSLSAQTAYAQLVDSLQSLAVKRCVTDVPGSFNRKEVSGKQYWYYQSRHLDGTMRQIYLGPESERLDALIETRKDGKRRPTTAPRATTALGAHAVALGAEPILPAHLRVVNKLADEGFFRAGGLLIGTHAFIAAGNMLGVRWGNDERTQDLDFAHAGKQLSLALPSNAKLDLHDAISKLEMGFTPVSSLDGVLGGSWIHPTDSTFRLDFVTTMDRTGKDLVMVPAFNAQFQALRFMEFSMEGVAQAAVFAKTGEPCLVSVPDPARMAIHKLIVSGLRSGTFTTKANKDISQAAALISFYVERSPSQIDAVYEDAMSRGPKWRKALGVGVANLQRRFPEVRFP
ncbi:MAG: nucleotidyltransferase domain-containing protein [Burkholderiales bacterium]|nr:nucleotidyltransferase domain-containing protein [Burkholderiales bacterium]